MKAVVITPMEAFVYMAGTNQPNRLTKPHALNAQPTTSTQYNWYVSYSVLDVSGKTGALAQERADPFVTGSLEIVDTERRLGS